MEGSTFFEFETVKHKRLLSFSKENGYFDRLLHIPNGYAEGLALALDKTAYIRSEIKHVEVLFSDRHMDIFPVYDNGTELHYFRVELNNLMDIGYSRVQEQPLTTFDHVWNAALNATRELLPSSKFSSLHNKKYNELTSTEKETEIVHYLCEGVAYAIYKGFLNEQLQKLQKGESIQLDFNSAEPEVEKGTEEVIFPVEGVPERFLLCDRLGILQAIAGHLGMDVSTGKFNKIMAMIMGVNKPSSIEKYLRIAQYDAGKEPTTKNNHRKPEHYEKIMRFLAKDVKIDNAVIDQLAKEYEIILAKYEKS